MHFLESITRDGGCGARSLGRQSHGWSHRLLTQCSRRDIDAELINSKRELEDRLGIEVRSLSVPGGRYDKDVILACLRAGYTELYHSNPWVPEQTAHGLRLKGRIMVNRRMDVRALSKQMQMSAAERFYFRTRYAAKDQLRAAFGRQDLSQIMVLAGKLEARRWDRSPRRPTDKRDQITAANMKILHLISSGGMYGAENVVLALARELQQMGHWSRVALSKTLIARTKWHGNSRLRAWRLSESHAGVAGTIRRFT